MALAGGLLTSSHAASDYGADSYFRAGGACIIRSADDRIIPPGGAARISCVDDARVVVRFRDRPGALPLADSDAVEYL